MKESIATNVTSRMNGSFGKTVFFENVSDETQSRISADPEREIEQILTDWMFRLSVSAQRIYPEQR